jgi:hypothetical protein
MPAHRLCLWTALLCAALPLRLVADGPVPAPAPQAGGAGDAIDSMCKMIPEGKKNLKVHIPGFDSTGRTSSLVTAATMTRVNPQELFCEIMRIDLYSKEPKDNVRIDLKTGTYHMDNKLLTSNERSKVSRSDFQIEGDSMQFDTVNSQGRMTGNVQMIIYDTSSFSAKKTPAPAKEPTPPGK